MIRLMQRTLLIALLTVCGAVSAPPAWAKFGVKSCYRRLGGCCDCRLDTCHHGCCEHNACKMQCHTVMKSVRQVHYENVQQTLFRTEYDTVWDERVVPIKFRVPHVTYNTVPYTYHRAVYHTVTKPVKYTVHVSVCEPRTRDVRYKVYHTSYEPRTKTVPYTTYRQVHETKTRNVPYTVYLPQYETVHRPYTYTMYRKVTETRQRVIPYTVCKPVHYTKTITVNTGHWETQTIERPGPVVTKCVQEPGCWEWDPCRCCCVYKPGPVCKVKVQCPPIKTCKRVWVPRVEQKQIQCVKNTFETHTRTEPYTVCRMQPETRTKMHSYTICKMVPHQRKKTISYPVTRMIPQKHTKVIHYTVAKVTPETRVKTVHYTVVRMVPQQRTKLVTQQVQKMIPETRFRKVAKTTWKEITSTKVIRSARSIPKQVPYTVTRCIPRVTYKQVPVRVCTTLPSCCGPNYSQGQMSSSYVEEGPALDAPVQSDMPIEGESIPPADGMPSPSEAPAGDAPAASAEMAENTSAPRAAAQEDFYTSAKDAHRSHDSTTERVSGPVEKLDPPRSTPSARAFYFRALALYDAGDQIAAEEMVRKAVRVERTHPMKNWGHAMERVQGSRRLWLENLRNRFKADR